MNGTGTYDHHSSTCSCTSQRPRPGTPRQWHGDLAVSAQFCLHRPPAEHGHNIAFSFGTVFPTGSDDVRDTVQTVNGPQQVFVDQSIQLRRGRIRYFAWYTGLPARKAGRALQLGNLPHHAAGAEGDSQCIVGWSEVQAQSAYVNNVDSGSIPRRRRYCLPSSKDAGMAAKFGMRYEGVKVRDL
jgi:hypothetical protein